MSFFLTMKVLFLDRLTNDYKNRTFPHIMHNYTLSHAWCIDALCPMHGA